MPSALESDEREALRALCHDMRGALNNLGTALSLCEVRAAGQPGLSASVDIALRGYRDSKEIFERIVQHCGVEDDGP